MHVIRPLTALAPPPTKRCRSSCPVGPAQRRRATGCIHSTCTMPLTTTNWTDRASCRSHPFGPDQATHQTKSTELSPDCHSTVKTMCREVSGHVLDINLPPSNCSTWQSVLPCYRILYLNLVSLQDRPSLPWNATQHVLGAYSTSAGIRPRGGSRLSARRVTMRRLPIPGWHMVATCC